MSATLSEADASAVVEAGDPATPNVLFRHRRRPPVLAFGVVGAAFAVLIGASSHDALVLAGCLAAAVALAVLGVLGRQRLWLEDQILTTTAAIVVRRDGRSVEVPYDRIACLVRRRGGIVLVRDDGARLAFDYNPHLRRMRPILDERAPAAQWDEEIPIACNT